MIVYIVLIGVVERIIEAFNEVFDSIPLPRRVSAYLTGVVVSLVFCSALKLNIFCDLGIYCELNTGVYLANALIMAMGTQPFHELLKYFDIGKGDTFESGVIVSTGNDGGIPKNTTNEGTGWIK